MPWRPSASGPGSGPQASGHWANNARNPASLHHESSGKTVVEQREKQNHPCGIVSLDSSSTGPATSGSGARSTWMPCSNRNRPAGREATSPLAHKSESRLVYLSGSLLVYKSKSRQVHSSRRPQVYWTESRLDRFQGTIDSNVERSLLRPTIVAQRLINFGYKMGAPSHRHHAGTRKIQLATPKVLASTARSAPRHYRIPATAAGTATSCDNRRSDGSTGVCDLAIVRKSAEVPRPWFPQSLRPVRSTPGNSMRTGSPPSTGNASCQGKTATGPVAVFRGHGRPGSSTIGPCPTASQFASRGPAPGVPFPSPLPRTGRRAVRLAFFDGCC